MLRRSDLDGAPQPHFVRAEPYNDQLDGEEIDSLRVIMEPEVYPFGINLDVTQVYLDGERVDLWKFAGDYVQEFTVQRLVELPGHGGIRMSLSSEYDEHQRIRVE